jgi:acid phosphatase
VATFVTNLSRAAATACTAVALGIAPAACGSDAGSGSAAGRTPTASPSTAAPASAGDQPATSRPGVTAGVTPGVTKVLVFVVENHSLAQMRAGMPKVYGFATRHAYATDYRAIRHPSLPNYIAVAAGSTLGVADDADPSRHRLTGTNLFRQALRSGHTAKVYAQSMPRRCALTDSGRYAVRHNPWTYFSSRADRAACEKYDVRAARLARDSAAGALPHVGFVIPDLVHDAHDGTLAQADAWISRQISTVTAGPDWRSGRLAIVVTADEDDSRSGNTVLTVVATRHQQPRTVTTPLSHYSLTGFLEDVLHVRHLRKARTAPSLARAFDVRVG